MNVSEKDLQVVFSCPLFSGIDVTHAKEILIENGCHTVEYAIGEVIFSPDAREKIIGFLLHGKATVATPDPGRNTLLRFLEAGELFGVSSLFSDAPFVSVITAQSACKVCYLTESAVRRLLESDTAFLYRYLGFLSGRVRYLNRKIGYLTAGSAERRLALYLSSLGTGEVRLDSSISSLSELLDVGRASLYRAFDKLQEDGFIQKSGRTILILQPEAMLQAYQ